MKWKMILVWIAVIASIIAIGTYGGIAFADPQHCDRQGWPSCYNVGFENGKANPGTSCPSGHSKNYCRGWEDGSGISSNPGSSLVPDRESKPSTSDGSSGKGTFKVTVEILVSPRLSFDQRPPAFSVTIDGQQQRTEVHITENVERPMSQQISDPVTSASTEYVLPKGQIPDGQSFNVCIKSTNIEFSFYDQCKTGFNSFGKKAETVTFSIG
jgi:hypothetical protein